MDFLIDENLPRSLAAEITRLGFVAVDVRDIGLRGQPDSAVLGAASARDAIIITRDRGFVFERLWPEDFTGGVIFINVPMTVSARAIEGRIVRLLTSRLPESLLGAVTIVEPHRAFSRTVRRRP